VHPLEAGLTGQGNVIRAAPQDHLGFGHAYRRVRAENQRLRAALREVRAKAIPAGLAVGLRREGWERRVCEVLDIIDDALER
jgi:hypothetical protein